MAAVLENDKSWSLSGRVRDMHSSDRAKPVNAWRSWG